jgi:hypothetical protein
MERPIEVVLIPDSLYRITGGDEQNWKEYRYNNYDEHSYPKAPFEYFCVCTLRKPAIKHQHAQLRATRAEEEYNFEQPRNLTLTISIGSLVSDR